MCDARDYAVGDVLGQSVDKKLNVIQYAIKKMMPCPKDIKGIRSFLGHAVFIGGSLRTSQKNLGLYLIYYKKIYHLSLMMIV